jgi:hypothetical protein
MKPIHLGARSEPVRGTSRPSRAPPEPVEQHRTCYAPAPPDHEDRIRAHTARVQEYQERHQEG